MKQLMLSVLLFLAGMPTPSANDSGNQIWVFTAHW